MHIGREDAYRLVRLLEDIDPDLTNAVNVKTFAERYCKASVTPMLVIFYQYSLACRGSNEKRVGFTSVKQFGKAKAETETQFQHIIDSCSYFDMICFMVHFLTIPDSRMLELFYWMAFSGQQKAVTEGGLLALFDAIYTEQMQQAAPSTLNARQKMQEVCQQLDMDGLTAYRLQLFDIRSGGHFTKALLGSKRTIIASTLGRAFWKRIGECFHAVTGHLEESYEQLEHMPFHALHQWREFVVNGDRKEARREVRRFVRIMMDFRKTETAEEGSAKLQGGGGGRVMSFFSNVLRGLPTRQRALSSTSASASSSSDPLRASSSLASKMLDKLLGRHYTAEEAQRVEEEEDVVPLEVRYKSALALSLEDIQQEVVFWEADARHALQDCEEVLLFAADLASEAGSLRSKHSRASLTMGGVSGKSTLSKQSRAGGSLRPMASDRQISQVGRSSRSSRKQIAGDLIQEEDEEDDEGEGNEDEQLGGPADGDEEEEEDDQGDDMDMEDDAAEAEGEDAQEDDDDGPGPSAQTQSIISSKEQQR